MWFLAKAYEIGRSARIVVKRACQRALCVLDTGADKLLRREYPTGMNSTKRCNGCGWTGRSFIDHPEGPAIACPWCGLIGRDRIVLRYLDEHLPGTKDLTCFEISISRVTQHLQRRFSRVVSIDTEPISNKQIKANLEALPFRDGCFDLIVCLDVMEHVKDDLAALRQIRRVLTPGGVALIHVPLWYMEGPIRTPEELGTPLYHGTSRVYREYNRDGMLKRLGEAGLAVHPINYPDDELDIGPSNPKGPITLFTCRRPATDILVERNPQVLWN